LVAKTGTLAGVDPTANGIILSLTKLWLFQIMELMNLKIGTIRSGIRNLGIDWNEFMGISQNTRE
jgi:hypothetical protein